MIIFVSVNLKQILKMQKAFPWPRPQICPHCKAHKVWGHGFLLAYFDEINTGIFIRRWRCPNCSTVIRMRPSGYLPRFQASISTIRLSIENKILREKWLRIPGRTRQQHWFKGLARKAKAFFGDILKGNPVMAFDYFMSRKIIPVTRSFKPAPYWLHL